MTKEQQLVLIHTTLNSYNAVSAYIRNYEQDTKMYKNIKNQRERKEKK